LLEEVEIVTKDMPGWLVNTDGKYTIALDVTITDELKEEGFAREFVNKIQNYRKDQDFEVTDRIKIQIKANGELKKAIEKHNDYICSQTLTNKIEFVEQLESSTEFDINGISAFVKITKN